MDFWATEGTENTESIEGTDGTEYWEEIDGAEDTEGAGENGWDKN